MLMSVEKEIAVPSYIKLQIKDNFFYINGELGSVVYHIPKSISSFYINNILVLSCTFRKKSFKSIFNTIIINIKNCFIGVSLGYQKKILIIGIGYKVKKENDFLEFSLGFSHTVRFRVPVGITIDILSSTEFIVKGVCKQSVGQIASDIRAIKCPDSYKGKGIRYFGEEFKLKAIKKK